MSDHVFHLIARSIGSIPQSLGSTWLGIIFPIVIALFGEVIGIVRFGWHATIKNWKRAAGIGFTALGIGYILLFMYCLIGNIYSDHMNLAAENKSLKLSLMASENETTTKLQTLAANKDADIEKLKINCAYKEGADGILREQLTTQQNQLNTCLVQQKEVPTIRTFSISRDSRPGIPRMEYVLATNVVRTPVSILATCDIPISDASISPMTETGSSAILMSQKQVSSTKFKFSIENPAWSPASPFWTTIFFRPPVNAMPSCHFTSE